jgi:Peptidase A4 family
MPLLSLLRRFARPAAACCAAAAALTVLTLGAASPASAAGTTLYGYVVTGSTFTSVTGSWHVPTVACGPTATSTSVWAGLDGYSSPTVEQIGTTVACSGGTASYYAWYELYPSPPVVFSNTVKPGDQIKTSVTADGSGKFTFKISDVTQAWSHTVTGHLSGAGLSSAEAFVQDPNCTAFGTVHFTGVTANGTPLGSLDPVRVAGTCPVTISPVSGSSFTVTA